MKQYLLTGGLATVLMLGACGGGEPSEEETPEENTTTEETTEDAGDASADEEASNGNDERIQALEDENEQLQEQVETLEEELEIAQSSSESADAEESQVSEDGDSEQTGDTGNLKTTGQGETLQLENINMTVEAAEVNRVTANQNDENMIMHQDLTAGDEADVIIIQYNVENTSEEPRTFFLDQAEIVTSNGHQLQSELMLAEGLNGEMQGAVSNTGTVPYILPDGSGEEVEWVDIIVPSVSDDSYMSLSEEQKYRIEF